MKKLQLGVCVVAATLSLSAMAEPKKQVAMSSAQSEMPVRIIIKQKDTVYAQSQDLTTYGQVVNKSSRYTSIEVPAAEVDSILSQLNQRADVEVAERDYPVSVPKPIKSSAIPVMMAGHEVASGASSFPPNDTYYGSQKYWLQQSTKAGRSSVHAARDRSEQNEKMIVAVLDGGFVNPTDMDYAGGYNFSVIDGSRDGDYLKDSSGCSNLHGTAVAGIIGAITDNSFGMAGIVNADIYAGRVLACDAGVLGDSAEGIRWAANDPTAEGTPLPRPADVINLSLTARTGACPTYLQDAIDYAVSRGSTVVVAAGNDNEDAADFSPANCNNVINVAAVNESGFKAGFSNFGPSIDIAAMGVDVLTMEGTDQFSFWSGTSFSSPLTAGVIALMKQNYPHLQPAEIESLLKSTSGSFATGYSTMGSGVVNAEHLMKQADALYGPQTVRVSHAMQAGERCQTQFYSDLFVEESGGHTKLCKMYEVDASEVYREADKSYVIFSVPAGQALTASNPNAVVERVSEDRKFLLPDVDSAAFDYGLQVCDGNGSGCRIDSLVDLNIEDVVKPASCNG